MRAILTLFSVICCLNHVIGQIDGFLSGQNIVQNGNQIDLSWTIDAGNTCLGTNVERSINGGPFLRVHAISGVCGLDDRPQTYRFSDENLDQTGRYVYNLGFGSIGTVSMEINFVEVWDSGLSIVFLPGDNRHRLMTTTEGRTYDVEIYSAEGRIVYSQTDISSRSFNLPSSNWSNGVYIVVLRSATQIARDKFLIYR